MVYLYCFVQVSDNSSRDSEVKTTTPLTSPVKLSRNNVPHASSAPSSVGTSGPETHGTPSLTPSDSDEGDKNKKKVHICFD